MGAGVLREDLVPAVLHNELVDLASPGEVVGVQSSENHLSLCFLVFIEPDPLPPRPDSS